MIMRWIKRDDLSDYLLCKTREDNRRLVDHKISTNIINIIIITLLGYFKQNQNEMEENS